MSDLVDELSVRIAKSPKQLQLLNSKISKVVIAEKPNGLSDSLKKAMSKHFSIACESLTQKDGRHL
jgi:hypothetical protein